MRDVARTFRFDPGDGGHGGDEYREAKPCEPTHDQGSVQGTPCLRVCSNAQTPVSDRHMLASLEEVMADSAAPLEDNDIHKGAMEDNRPGPERSSHPGLDANGLPNDPIAIASDMLGANVDKSQG